LEKYLPERQLIQFKQDDHDIKANISALIRHLHKSTGATQVPLELYLYTTIPPFLVHQNPSLTIHRTIHVPKPSSNDIKVQRPGTVYPPDHQSFLSNASPLVPIADFPGVGHPSHLRPKRVVKRYLADAQWQPAESHALDLANYKAGLRLLAKKKKVYKWHINRTEEQKQTELAAGFRRSGDPLKTVEKLVL
jgi:hypothetical protein